MRCAFLSILISVAVVSPSRAAPERDFQAVHASVGENGTTIMTLVDTRSVTRPRTAPYEFGRYAFASVVLGPLDRGRDGELVRFQTVQAVDCADPPRVGLVAAELPSGAWVSASERIEIEKIEFRRAEFRGGSLAVARFVCQLTEPGAPSAEPLAKALLHASPPDTVELLCTIRRASDRTDVRENRPPGGPPGSAPPVSQAGRETLKPRSKGDHRGDQTA